VRRTIDGPLLFDALPDGGAPGCDLREFRDRNSDIR
jgi:hypothetical protein